jgi:hypothetical protein
MFSTGARGKGQIIGRRQSPKTLRVHQKAELFPMIVAVVGVNIEDGTPEHFNHGAVVAGNVERQAQEIAVVEAGQAKISMQQTGGADRRSSSAGRPFARRPPDHVVDGPELRFGKEPVEFRHRIEDHRDAEQRVESDQSRTLEPAQTGKAHSRPLGHVLLAQSERQPPRSRPLGGPDRHFGWSQEHK